MLPLAELEADSVLLRDVVAVRETLPLAEETALALRKAADEDEVDADSEAETERDGVAAALWLDVAEELAPVDRVALALRDLDAVGVAVALDMRVDETLALWLFEAERATVDEAETDTLRESEREADREPLTLEEGSPRVGEIDADAERDAESDDDSDGERDTVAEALLDKDREALALELLD